MEQVKLLDCTLREAPLDGLMWGDLAIKRVVGGLEKAGVNIIEVGFLKNNPYRPGSTSFRTVREIEPYLTNKLPETMYVALVDYGRYDLSQLEPNDGRSIDAIRVCFKHHQLGEVLEYARQIKDKGYQVCIQHVDTMGFTDQEIVDFVREVNELKPFAYSVVDTFGAMYADDALRLTSLAAEHLSEDIWLGFHGHNNLMLADANAQAFLDRFFGTRKVIVDSSLYGCGRSAGNAHTELIAQYMNRKHGGTYGIDNLLDLIDTVISAAQEKTTWGYSVPYFIAGMLNAHTFNVKQLLKRHNLKSKDLRGIMSLLDETQKKAYDYALLEKLYVEYFDNPIDDADVVATLGRKFDGRKVLILAPGKSIVERKGDIVSFIRKENPIVIGVNNLIDGYALEYVFYSGAVRYGDLQFQDYEAAGKPHIIVTSNIEVDGSRGEIIVDYRSLIEFGWVNIDSSAVLLLRLLARCGVHELYAAGMDGYMKYGDAFYRNDLDTGLAENDRIEHTRENLEMMRNMRERNPKFKVHFITPSIYEEVFE